MHSSDIKGIQKIRIISCLLFIILVLGFCVPADASAKTTTVMADNNGTITAYSYKGQKVTVDGVTVSTQEIPSVKIQNIWMVSAQEVFENGLGCNYSYNESSGKLTLTNQEKGIKASLTVNSKKAVVNGKSYTMSIRVMKATNGKTGKTGILIPASFLANKMGYVYKYSNKTIALKKLVLFSQNSETLTYNTSKYQNAVSGITAEQNKAGSRQTLKIDTVNDTSAETVTISEDSVNGVLTYTFHNTSNLLGKISSNLNSFIKKLTVEEEGSNTVIKIWYHKKYTYMSSVGDYGAVCTLSSSAYSMKIKLPDGVAFSSVKTTDQYDKKQFLIEIPGNYKSYYKQNPIILNNNQIHSVSTTYTSAGNTRIRVKTKKIQGFALTEKNGHFIVKIANPNKIYQNIVVLDAGHGGKDNGASKRGTKEKVLNHKILYTRAKGYFDGPDSEIKVYYTRTKNIFIPLMDRAKFASQVGADLFVSLHMNSCSSSSVNGLEIFYSKDNNAPASSGLTSRILARQMHKQLIGDLDASSRGVKTANFVVTRYNTVPSILIELGFLSGNSDYKKLTSPSYQKQAAKSIYDSISAVFDKYPTQR